MGTCTARSPSTTSPQGVRSRIGISTTVRSIPLSRKEISGCSPAMLPIGTSSATKSSSTTPMTPPPLHLTMGLSSTSTMLRGSSSTISMPPRLTAPTISSSSTPRRLRTSTVRALASTQATPPAYSSTSTAIRTSGTSLRARVPRTTRGISSTTSSRTQSPLVSRAISRTQRSVSSC